MDTSHSQPDRLRIVDNNECILIEFVNDDNSLAVGYASWMKEDDIEKVQTLISQKTEIEIMWPDCSIQTAMFMKTKLKTATFTAQVVRLLELGEWTKLQKHKENLIKYGEISPSKERRRRLKTKVGLENKKRKILLDDKENHKNSQQTISSTSEAKVLLKDIEDSKKTEKNNQISYDSESSGNESDTGGKSAASNSENDDENDDNGSQKSSQTSSYASDEPDEFEKSEKEPKDFNELNELNEPAKPDESKKPDEPAKPYDSKKPDEPKKSVELEEPVEIDGVDESILTKNQLQQELVNVKEELASLKLQYEHLEVEKINIETDFVLYKEKIEQEKQQNRNDDIQMYKKMLDQSRAKMLLINEVSESYIHTLDESYEPDSPTPCSPVASTSKEDQRKNPKKMKSSGLGKHTSNPAKRSASGRSSPEIANKKPKSSNGSSEKGSSGGYSLKSSILKNLNKSDAKSYINDLLENVFTDEELINSCATGKKCNAIKDEIEAKPGLDPERMDYIRKLVFDRFGKTKQNRTLINKCASNKISYKRSEDKKR